MLILASVLYWHGKINLLTVFILAEERAMDIRVAKNSDDSKSASYIYANGWKAGYRGIFTDKLLNDIPNDFWVNAFNSNYATHRFEIAIISIDGQDVGAGKYGLSRDYNESDIGEITSIYFLQQAWGKGYSKVLMDFMIAKLREKGCKKIHLWVLKDNLRAQRFYEKYGFKKTGNEKSFCFKDENKIDIEYIV